MIPIRAELANRILAAAGERHYIFKMDKKKFAHTILAMDLQELEDLSFALSSYDVSMDVWEKTLNEAGLE